MRLHRHQHVAHLSSPPSSLLPPAFLLIRLGKHQQRKLAIMAGAAASGGKERPVKPLGWVWFSGLMLGMTACLPYIIEYMCSKSYATHRHGVVLVTSATSAVGKAACLALLADGYTVRV